MFYPINEIFQSFQGEGYFTNVPAIFIRLQGCPVGCSWCDTKYTWEKKSDREVDIQYILSKNIDSDNWGNANELQILKILQDLEYSARHVIITGGEPCIYNLVPLTAILEKNGYRCQIETSGTHKVYCSVETWVTVSAKVNMRGKLKVLKQSLERADEIKHPVARERDIQQLEELLDKLHDNKKRIISLQPINTENKQINKTMQLCIKTCIERNWRLSIQMHKYLNIA